MEETTLKQRIDEVAEWLETHEIDDPDYVDKFAEMQQLEGLYEAEFEE